MDDANNRTGMHGRVWRRDRGAILSGVCAGLAEDLDLPLPVIRAVGLIFLVLPTGLAYLALSMLMRRRPIRHGVGSSGATRDTGRRNHAATPPASLPNFALLAHRFEMLEPRLKRIEAFVTSSDFELHRGFRRMDEQDGVRRVDK